MTQPMPQSINPYQAPQVDRGPVGLASDIEFLVSGQCVLCDDDVELPEVCIVTGQTEQLVRRQKVLVWVPGWRNRLGALLFLLTFVLYSNLMGALDRRRFGAIVSESTWAELLPFAVGSLFLFSGIVSIGIWGRQRRVDVTWYISSLVDGRHRRAVKRFWIVTSLSVALLIMSASLQVVFDDAATLLAGCGIIGILLSLRFLRPTEPSPVVIGTHEGLYVLSEFSPQFLAKVQAMIDEYNGDS